MSQSTPIVPAAVRDAFGAAGEPVALDGGEGVTVRCGGVVLKRVHDVAEAEWVQEVQSGMREDGFRLARPVRSAAGGWTYAGWSASQFIGGLRPLAPDWHAVAAVGLRFGDVADAARHPDPAMFAARTHRWAVADRFAWGETCLDLAPDAAEVHAGLRTLLGGPRPGCQIVHGDLAGNVHVDRSGVPVVLDFSPYLRPRAWAAAIVVADAVLWNGAAPALARSFAGSATGRDHLGRALIFRMAAEQLATDPRHGAHLEPYRRVLSAVA